MSSLQILISGYQDMQRKKSIDLLIRREIARTAQRARSYIENIHDRFVKNGLFEMVIAKQCMQEIDRLMEDIDKEEGVSHGFISRSMTQRDMNKLIKHDYDVIQMVVEPVRLSNERIL